MENCIITGMHRSGTSYTASLLKKSGLKLGKRMGKPNAGNSKGYYENEEFLEFHMKVLDEKGLHKDGWDPEEVSFDSITKDHARKLIMSQASSCCWGWKDPRSVLFLNAWDELLPNASYVFLYRSPNEVVNSLFRRADPYFLEFPERTLFVWNKYNQLILDFFHRNEDRCVLVNIKNVIQQPELFIDHLNKKFNLGLQVSGSEEFNHSLFHDKEQENFLFDRIIKECFQETTDLWHKLESCENIHFEKIKQEKPHFDEAFRKEIMHTWLAHRKGQYLAQKNACLEDRLQYLLSTNGNYSVIEALNEEIDWMKGSKFWKLRSYVLRVKKAILDSFPSFKKESPSYM